MIYAYCYIKDIGLLPFLLEFHLSASKIITFYKHNQANVKNDVLLGIYRHVIIIEGNVEHAPLFITFRLLCIM
jgi:hypothetical protein